MRARLEAPAERDALLTIDLFDHNDLNGISSSGSADIRPKLPPAVSSNDTYGLFSDAIGSAAPPKRGIRPGHEPADRAEPVMQGRRALLKPRQAAVTSFNALVYRFYQRDP